MQPIIPCTAVSEWVFFSLQRCSWHGGQNDQSFATCAVLRLVQLPGCRAAVQLLLVRVCVRSAMQYTSVAGETRGHMSVHGNLRSGWAQLAQISFRVALLYLAVSQFEMTLWLVIYWHYLQHADNLNHHSPNHPLPILKQHWYDMRPAMQGS